MRIMKHSNIKKKKQHFPPEGNKNRKEKGCGACLQESHGCRYKDFNLKFNYDCIGAETTFLNEINEKIHDKSLHALASLLSELAYML